MPKTIFTNIKRMAAPIKKLLVFVMHRILGKKRCPICGNRIIRYSHFDIAYLDEYFKYKFIHPITAYETFNAVSFSCPICRTSDSARLYSLYLRETLSNPQKEIYLLDIAPTTRIAELIKSFDNVKYRSADLYMKDVDDNVDLTDMSIYGDGTFDMIVCTHVLEHIKDDVRALKELFRVLKPGGQAIIQVPVLTTLEEDYETDLAVTAADHWRHYGEPTHVRVYSKNGYLKKLIAAGFDVNQLGADHFGEDKFNKNGITFDSVLYVAKK